MERADFMSDQDKAKMGNSPRTHYNCDIYTGRMRPGKTAKDRALKDKGRKNATNV